MLNQGSKLVALLTLLALAQRAAPMQEHLYQNATKRRDPKQVLRSVARKALMVQAGDAR